MDINAFYPVGTKFLLPNGDIYQVTTVRMWGYHFKNLSSDKHTQFIDIYQMKDWELVK